MTWIHLYIWISIILLIAVFVRWYFIKEGFQMAAAGGATTSQEQTSTNFWNMVQTLSAPATDSSIALTNFASSTGIDCSTSYTTYANVSPDVCATNCLKDPNCGGFSFLNNNCWLKKFPYETTELPVTSSTPTCTKTGTTTWYTRLSAKQIALNSFKLFPSTDCKTTRALSTYSSTTPGDCAVTCLKDPNCGGFSFSNNSCSLKTFPYTSTADPKAANAGCDSVSSNGISWYSRIGDQPTVQMAVSRVSDPDPSDPEDTMPLSFSKYISVYALAKYNSDVSGARAALFNNYDALQKEMSTNLSDQKQIASWSADPINASCSQLDNLRSTFMIQYADVINSMKDLSGSSYKASAMHTENLGLQQQLIGQCQSNPLSPACISLASQDKPMFDLLAKYESANNNLFSNQLDISNNLQTVNNTYVAIGCKNPNQLFTNGDTASPLYFWVDAGVKNKYPVTSCSQCGGLPCANAKVAPKSFFDSLPTGKKFTCSMISASELIFSDSQTGSIDTTTLRSNLQQLSPYYISPDVLQSITASIMSASDTSATITTTSDILIDINNVIANIKLLTNTK